MSRSSLANISDLEYYQSQPDFEEFRQYLDSDPVIIDEQAIPSFKPDFSSIIVVEDVPLVGKDKLAKLMQALVKLFVQVIVTDTSYQFGEKDIYMPFDEENNTSFGFCFITFPAKEDSDNAILLTNNYKFGKNIFKVNPYSMMEEFANLSENDLPPPIQNFHPRPDTTTWCKDLRDQFAIRHVKETEIWWMNGVAEGPSVLYAGEREKTAQNKVWCDSHIEWSPQGTYLATFHNRGVKLWGGADFQPLGRFEQTKTDELTFSSDELYLITSRLTTPSTPSADGAASAGGKTTAAAAAAAAASAASAASAAATKEAEEAIIIWDVRVGQKLRSFPLKNPLENKFFAQAVITLEDVKTFKKVDKVIRGKVKDFNNGYFSIEEGNTIHVDIPARNVIPLQDPNKFKFSCGASNHTPAALAAGKDGKGKEAEKGEKEKEGCKYVARVGADCINIYDLHAPKMELLGKKSLPAPDILDFMWSPKDNFLSYWSPAVGNHPAIISIVKIPEKTEIGSRKLVDVSDGKMIWQSEGDYLCVYMTKAQSKKKSYVFLFFRLRSPGVPVEQLELFEPILQVAWEPAGDRIAISSGDVRNPTISFYSMVNVIQPLTTIVATPGASVVSGVPGAAGVAAAASTATAGAAVAGGGPVGAAIPGAAAPSKGNKAASGGAAAAQAIAKNELTLLFTKSSIQCNDIQWSPYGNFVTLAYFATDCCRFEILDVDNHVTLATRQHDRCNRLAWDPSGRYIATSTITEMRNNNARGNKEDGINFYHFQGTLIHQLKKEKLNVFTWRPRPRDLLTVKEKKLVYKNIKKYEKAFEEEDRAKKDAVNKELREKRFKMAKEFLTWRNRNRAINATLKMKRVSARNGYDSDDDRNYEIVTVEK